MTDTPMTSHRPYLLRALYEWIADNGMTPHILVDAAVPGVRVPKHAIGDGRVVLNIADRAVAKLQMDNECIRFSARFGGMPQQVQVPVGAVLAIYARETGQGMALPADAVHSPQAQQDSATLPVHPSTPVAAVSADRSVPAAGSASPDDTDPPPSSPPPPSANRRAHLRVVK